MTNEERNEIKVKLAAGARSVADSIKYKKNFEFGTGFCVYGGTPCCSFGHVLKEAEVDLAKKTFIYNTETLLELLGFKEDVSLYDLSKDVSDALDDLTKANDDVRSNPLVYDALLRLANKLDQWVIK